jgi:uncharacterized protein
MKVSANRKLLYSERRLVKEIIGFRGHPMVRSLHPTTIEVTTETHLTEKGDCIIGVSATKGCLQLSEEVKEGLRRKDSLVTIRIAAGDHVFVLSARGDPRLELSHPHDMVIRKSDFASDRTLAVRADAAARNIPREMVRVLRDPATSARLEIEVS